MALAEIRQLADGVRMGLWRMDETAAEMLQRYPRLQQLEMPYKSEARRMEFLCVRAMLHEMSGNTDLTIGHTDSGRPFVEGATLPPSISISHTKGYAVLIVSEQKDVGVDIEYRSDRITKIADRFVRNDEQAATVDELLALWCAKETLYKLYSADNLQYMEMRKLPTDNGKPGADDGDCGSRSSFLMENMKRGETVRVYCESTNDYVLTYAWTGD